MSAYNTYTQSLVFSSSSSQSATISTGFPNVNVVLGDLYVSSSGAFTGQATLTFYNHSDMLDSHIVYIATLEMAANSLASAATSGTNSIVLNSAAGFAPYNKLLIVADGTNPNERQRIAVNGISGSTLTLGGNLANNHNSASVVTCLPEFGGFSLQDVSSGSNIYVTVSFSSPQTVNLELEIFGFAALGAGSSINLSANPLEGDSAAGNWATVTSSSTSPGGHLTSLAGNLSLESNSTNGATPGYVQIADGSAFLMGDPDALAALVTGEGGIVSPFVMALDGSGSLTGDNQGIAITMCGSGTYGADPQLNFGAAYGSVASGTYLPTGQGMGAIAWSVWGGSTPLDNPGILLQGIASPSGSAQSHLDAGSALKIYTAPAGSTSLIESLGLQGNNVTLNGQSYVFPSSQTANYYLQTDGAGNLSWAAAGGGGVTYPLLAPNGSGQGYSFSSNPTSEMYSSPAGEITINSNAADGVLLSYNSNTHYIEIYSGGVEMDVLYVDTNIYPTGQILPPYNASASAPPYSFLGKTNSGMIWDNTNLGVGFVYSGTECLVVGAGPSGTGAGMYAKANPNYITLGQSSHSAVGIFSQNGSNGIIELFADGGMAAEFGQGQCYMQATGDNNAFILGPNGSGYQGIAINNLDANPIASTCIDLHNAGPNALCLPNTTTGAIATPHNGMLIYDTTALAIMAYVNGAWVAL
jgi:hypothetical protein